MASVSKTRKRLAATARWLAPSAVAACAGALAAGAFEAIAMEDALGGIAAIGFLEILAIPILFAASVVARGLWAAWRPDELSTSLVEDSGAAPRLAAWALVIALGALTLAWVMFQGTWVLAGWTAFKPLSLSFLEPILAVSATLILLAASRPAANGLTWAIRKLDARWRARGHGSLVTPWKIAIAIAIGAMATLYAIWGIVVRPRIGVLQLGVLQLPASAIIVTALAHGAWDHLGTARRFVGSGIVVVAAFALATALYASRAEPSLTLSIWGDRPIAGLAIDKLFSLDAIRSRVSLEEFKPVERAGAAHPDIILVTIDTVRADHTPPYGGVANMPALRGLAEHGTVFEYAFAPSNVTRRSIPSMTIGLQPNRIRGRVVGWALRVDPRHVMVAERLRAGGYDTAGFVCCEGFWGSDFRTGLERGLAHLEIEPNGTKLARQAVEWLTKREQQPNRKPLFLWMHILEPHNWAQAGGDAHSDDDRRKLYDRMLAAADTMVVDLRNAFPTRAPEQQPIFIVTADHGEALGDHGQPFHSTDLYNSQIRVPFVVAGPGIQTRRVAETVSLTDLVPTLVELAGFEPPTGRSIDGRSVADLLTGRRDEMRDAGIAFAAMIKDRSNPGGITAIVKGRYKLIDSGSAVELYDVHADPDERSNIVTVRQGIANEMKALLEQHVKMGAKSPF